MRAATGFLDQTARAFRGGGPIWVLTAFFLAGVALATAGAWTGFTEYRLRTAALAAEGVVLKKEVVSRRAGRIRHVRYEFRPRAGSHMTGSGRLDEQAWSALREGSRVKVLYLPDNPAKNRIALKWSDWTAPGFFSGFGLFLAAVTLFGFRMVLSDLAAKKPRRAATRKKQSTRAGRPTA